MAHNNLGCDLDTLPYDHRKDENYKHICMYNNFQQNNRRKKELTIHMKINKSLINSLKLGTFIFYFFAYVVFC